MKNIFFPGSIMFLLCSVLFSCQADTPEKCFDVAVLNANMYAGFAGDGLLSELESPSVKMGKTEDETVPMQRVEVIGDKIKFAEATLSELQSLSVNEDNKDIIQASLALHLYILPVYKTEYTQLVKAFDAGTSKEQAELQAQVIHDKYFPKFEMLYNDLISKGKQYADKHHIQVQWTMHFVHSDILTV